jgi:CrcB protein
VAGLLWVALGGALGSAGRYGVVRGVAGLVGDGWPLGVLVVNVLGSFAAGILVALLSRKLAGADQLQLFLITGFLGGFTTFSAFSLDVMHLMQRGENATAVVYALASVLLSVVAVFAGLGLMRAVA